MLLIHLSVTFVTKIRIKSNYCSIYIKKNELAFISCI